ncbi:hypothetical protein MMC20_002208 [Loxospora ochrophaea]|nr:hypothetical protein [Loxospora ochrophaea]
MYARGILFGKMKYELGDHSYVRCPEQHLVADIEFKTKGWVGGKYNAIEGVIKNDKTGETLFEISGMWSGEMVIKNNMNGHKELLFNATNAKHTPPLVRPLEEQDDRESQKLWYKTVTALKERNQDAATDDKTRIEDQQREETAQRASEGIDWQPKLFRKVRGGPGESEEGEEDLDWILNANIDGPTPEAQIQQILAVAPILPGQKAAQQPSTQQPTQPQAPQKTAGGTDDLIDFGGDPATPVQSTPVQAPHSQDLHSIGNTPTGLQEPLMPGEPLQRQDTKTKEVDTFVDAQD